MRGQDFLDRIENIDPAYIEAAYTPKKKPNKNKIKKYATLAACLLVAFSIGFGVRAYAAEVKEYNAAVVFFEENNLSTQGLTRNEIKKVYRDITTKAFTYFKTADVILESLSTEQIEGYEIWQDEPTPEDIENLWNYKTYGGGFVYPEQSDKDGFFYDFRSEYDDSFVFMQSHLEKHFGDKLLWDVTFSRQIDGYLSASNGLIVYGETDRNSSEENVYLWSAFVDENGNVIWETQLDNGFHTEYVSAVFENEDGGYTFISRGDSYFLCMTKIMPDGRKAYCTKNEVGDYGIGNVTPTSNGYIVHLVSYMSNEYAKIVLIDSEGTITDSFSYDSADIYYHITDMMEYEGKIYLSTYATPKNEDDITVGRHEIQSIVHYLFSNKLFEISSEELTPIVRNNYTAILLVCDPESGTPQEFYSVDGSLGGKLSLTSSGELSWDVESITTTFFSPATSSFTIGGTCYVYEYEFDKSGLLVSSEKTERVVNFRK
ncbi:MAG: hypothetical protein E7611_01095 [Ruminococcaceae bacterium]|nr:hypothetical protein [Oscillospiraceae bacterium]